MLLTLTNAHPVAGKLAHLRGATMKVGQLLSMDAEDLLPPEISIILARLWADAAVMPVSQVVAVLEVSWGDGWLKPFGSFPFRSWLRRRLAKCILACWQMEAGSG